MYRIIQKRNYLFGLSLVLLIPGIIGLSLWGLRLGIDFTGGTLMSLMIPTSPSTEDIQPAIIGTGVEHAVVQQTSDGYVARLPHITNEQHQKTIDELQKKYPGSEETSYETVGPTVGKELQRRAISAVSAVLIAIILFITWAFRKVSRGPVPSWIYGLSALLALLHDVLMVVGAFAILGHFFDIEIDALFVTALLTVLGFSVHDTIVVFDRIRERLRVSTETSFELIVNESLNQTLVRSINTSLTTVIVLTALAIFGGGAIRSLVLALIIGIVSGTYSSIFVASPLLVVYEKIRHRT